MISKILSKTAIVRAKADRAAVADKVREKVAVAAKEMERVTAKAWGKVKVQVNAHLKRTKRVVLKPELKARLAGARRLSLARPMEIIFPGERQRKSQS